MSSTKEMGGWGLALDSGDGGARVVRVRVRVRGADTKLGIVGCACKGKALFSADADPAHLPTHAALRTGIAA